MAQNWNRAEDMFLPRAKQGIHFYSFPDENVLEQCYSRKRQPVEALVGTYQIIYYHAQYYREEYHERTTRGTVTFHTCTQPSLDARYPGTMITALFGRIAFDKTLPRDQTGVSCFYADYGILDIVTNPDDDDEERAGHDHNNASSSSSSSTPHQQQHQYSWNRTFGFTPTRGGVIIEPDRSPNRIQTKLHVLQQRVACPWIPLEGNNRLALEAEFGDYNKLTPTSFDTVEEAETLVEMHQDRTCIDDSDSWICNHLHLPPDVAKRILAFATSSFKPSPVFFMEPGDLFLETAWSGSFNFPFISHIVARKIDSA
jgi:hypothetical protein